MNKIVIVFLVIGIIESFIFAVLFSIKAEKKLPDKIIGVWLLILAIQTIFIAVSLENQNTYYAIKPLQTSILLLHGVFLFLYTDKLIRKNAIFKINDFLHFVPIFLCIATILLFKFLQIQSEVFIKIIALSGIISGLVYNLYIPD